MYKLIFFVPINTADRVKNAIFATGAGSLGHYSHCSFETQGVGQFLPNDKANPAIGSQNILEKVDELKVEILCSRSNIQEAIKALKANHPYEEPAYEVLRVYNEENLPKD